MTKPTNPKDAVGINKAPMGLLPDTAIVAGNLAFLEGALKYGRYNWRVAGVRASIYNDALERHRAAWWNGEDIDPQSSLPHLYKMLACVAIMIDAMECNKLTDDRPPVAPVAELLEYAEERARIIKEKMDEHMRDKDPVKQFTIEDSRAIHAGMKL